MESFFDRYKNSLVLMAVLVVQIFVLATQVKRPSDPSAPNSSKIRLIRVWAATAFAPFERALVGTGHFFRNGWHNYVDLHGVRRENQQLQQEVTKLRMEEVRLRQDAEQAHRLQALLGFREKFISQTVAAQVIGASGSDQSKVIYIDKGTPDGIKTDMAVITPDGIVGKVKDVFPLSAQVLMINDRESGAGVILEKTRLQGVLRGTGRGELQVEGVMADQPVTVGEQLISSGGDRIYPKGLPVGTVTSVAPDRDTGTFLAIRVKPSADLNRLEEVLVVTKMTEQAPDATAGDGHARAADILAQRLPTVPKVEQLPLVTDDKPRKINAVPELKNQPSENAVGSGKGKPEKPATEPGSEAKPRKKVPPATPGKQPVQDNNGQPPGRGENPLL